MRTIRIKAYKFDELSDQAKETARDWYRGTLSYDDSILWGFDETCSERAKELGFNDIKIQYSLNSCQGDGLSFSGDIDLKLMISELMPDLKQSVIKVLTDYCVTECKGNDGRYCFASKSDIELHLEPYKYNDYPNLTKIVAELETAVQCRYLNLCKDLEKEGYDWIDYAYSDESVTENIINNEYEFTKEGKRI